LICSHGITIYQLSRNKGASNDICDIGKPEYRLVHLQPEREREPERELELEPELERELELELERELEPELEPELELEREPEPLMTSAILGNPNHVYMANSEC
jgi:hypothetical protein